MFAAVLLGDNDLQYREAPRPELGPGDVMVRVRACGVCGSDIPRVFAGAAHFYPLVLGHEFAGYVTEVGPEISDDWLGQRVAVAPLVPCHACERCTQGQYSLCPNYRFIGSSLDGGLAQYVRVPARNLVPLGDDMSYVQGALVEPSSVALHALLVGGYKPGLDVAVLGGGTIGNLTAQWAKLYGARSVSVVDLNADRLQVAREVGVDHVIDALTQDLFVEADRITAGAGFGHVFETAGANATQAQALQLAAPAATVTLVGTSPRDVSFDVKVFELLNRKELTLNASWMSYSAPFPGIEWTQTIRYMQEGRLLTPASLLHQEFPLEQAASAMELFRGGEGVKGKIIFLP